MTVSPVRDAENVGRPIFPQTEKLNKEIEKKNEAYNSTWSWCWY